jgi:hypothetical protein
MRTMPIASTAGPWAEEPDADARRIAEKRREAHGAEEAAWLDIAGAFAGGSTDNPANLLEACRSGKIRHLFRHKSRWWMRKPVRPDVLRRAAIFEGRLVGVDGSELENGQQWQFQINKSDWCRHLGKPAASACSPDVPPPVTEKVRLPNAPEAEIRKAIKAEYSETKIAGLKPPNINEIRPRVQERLKAQGFYASQAHIARIGEEFGSRRIKSGRTWEKKKLPRAKASPKKCPPNANF